MIGTSPRAAAFRYTRSSSVNCRNNNNNSAVDWHTHETDKWNNINDDDDDDDGFAYFSVR